MEYIVGTHDFKSFSKNKITKNTVRTIESFTLSVNKGILEFAIVGDGFMYNMVRIIAGTLVEIGLGKMEPENISEIIKSQKRENAGKTLPPNGLYLLKVMYD